MDDAKFWQECETVFGIKLDDAVILGKEETKHVKNKSCFGQVWDKILVVATGQLEDGQDTIRHAREEARDQAIRFGEVNPKSIATWIGNYLQNKTMLSSKRPYKTNLILGAVSKPYLAFIDGHGGLYSGEKFYTAGRRANELAGYFAAIRLTDDLDLSKILPRCKLYPLKV
jgi:20S proteasome alpha/beta subunit